jgi:formiminotetrahydrofolate cyclodeaminase
MPAMDDFGNWLNAMAHEPLPGGLSAAAVAAAMGTALIFKAFHSSLDRQSLTQGEERLVVSLLEVAHQQQANLVRFAEADKEAYRAVLAARQAPEGAQDLVRARQAATRVPIQTARACAQVLQALSQVEHLCWPTVQPDVAVGRMLLEIGQRTGVLIARTNLRTWGTNISAELRDELNNLSA